MWQTYLCPLLFTFTFDEMYRTQKSTDKGLARVVEENKNPKIKRTSASNCVWRMMENDDNETKRDSWAECDQNKNLVTTQTTTKSRKIIINTKMNDAYCCVPNLIDGFYTETCLFGVISNIRSHWNMFFFVSFRLLVLLKTTRQFTLIDMHSYYYMDFMCKQANHRNNRERV